MTGGAEDVARRPSTSPPQLGGIRPTGGSGRRPSRIRDAARPDARRGAWSASTASPALVLASGSPRRRELLARLGVDFDVVAAGVDESVRPGEAARRLVRRLAVAKARAVAASVAADTVVLAADTTVVVDGEILGKPADDEEARSTLRRLSGRQHHVHTGVAVARGEWLEAAVATTLVRFVALTPAAIEWYVATGEPFDKAGAYALQGVGGVFVDAVRGSVSNVVGLPLTTTVALLRRAGLLGHLGGERPGSGTLPAQNARWDESRPDGGRGAGRVADGG